MFELDGEGAEWIWSRNAKERRLNGDWCAMSSASARTNVSDTTEPVAAMKHSHMTRGDWEFRIESAGSSTRRNSDLPAQGVSQVRTRTTVCAGAD